MLTLFFPSGDIQAIFLFFAAVRAELARAAPLADGSGFPSGFFFLFLGTAFSAFQLWP